MSLASLADKIGRAERLTPGERGELVAFLTQMERIAARVQATDHGGSSRDVTFSQLTVDKDLIVDTGTARIGPVAAGKGNILLSSGGILLRTNTTGKINLKTNGDVLIGEDISAAATTNIAIFTAAQTYNSESMAAGDMLIGDNSSGKANILWDKSAGTLIFRGGTTPTTTIDTSGLLNLANNTNIRWTDSGGTPGKGTFRYNASNAFALTNNTASAEINFTITLTDASAPALDWQEDAGQANRSQLTLNGGAQGGKFVITDGSALADTVIQTAGGSGGSAFATFPGAVNVGTGSSTTAGELTVSGSATIATGLNLGSGSGAGTGAIVGSSSITLAGGATFGTADSTNGVITSNVFASSTNAYLDSFVLNRYTSGTAAANLGLLIKTQLEDAGGTIQKALQIGARWVDATAVSRKAQAVFYIEDTGTREAFRIEASGSAPMIGFLGANAVVRQTSGADLTNNVTSGGTDNTIADYSSLTTYSTDAAAIRNNIYQLARKLKQVNDALRDYGLLT